MRIGVIQASSQAGKNEMMFRAVQRFAADADVINFGCREQEIEQYSYVEIALLIGLLLGGGAVDFVVTGCSSGQGMMLACNSVPGVLCGYAPTPTDAYLFAQINDGNAVSLPLGEGYTWKGRGNMEATLQKLFSEPFGQGYPKAEAERKKRDTALLKALRAAGQADLMDFLNGLDRALVKKLLARRDVIDYVLLRGGSAPLTAWFRRQRDACGMR